MTIDTDQSEAMMLIGKQTLWGDLSELYCWFHSNNYETW
jgi:hypothetical protein